MAFDAPDVQQDPTVSLASLATNPQMGQPQASAAPVQDSQPAPATATPALTPQGPHWTQPAPDPNFSEKFGAGMVSTLSDPRIASQPGAWAKSVLLNSVHAMAPNSFGAKLAAAINPVMNSLGDAASGQRSAAGAIGQTLANRQKRIAGQNQQDFQNDQEQQKNQVLIAEANSRMHNEQLLSHKMGEDAINQSVETGKQGLAAMMKVPADGIAPDIAAEGVTSDEMQNAIAQKHLDPTKVTAFATGRKITGENPDGTPQYRTTYTVVQPPHEVKLEAGANLDLINKFGRGPGEKPLQEGQVLPGAQFNSLLQRAMDNQTLTTARDKTLEDAKITDAERTQHLEAVNFGGGSEWSKTLGAFNNDPIKTLAYLQKNPPKNPDGSPKYPNLSQDVMAQYGGPKNWLDISKEQEKERHDEREEQIQNRRADVQATKETQQKGLGDSYKTENKEFDTIRKPLATSLDAFSTLRNSLDQGTAAGDSVVAPALLKALVAGGGVRITQAEINNFTHGRSSLEDMKGTLQKLTNGKSITPVQRQQVYALLGAVESKVRAKNDILNTAQEQLDGAQSVADQRAAVSNARRKLDAIDKGETIATTAPTNTGTPNAGTSTSGSDPFAQFGGKAH